MYNRLPRFYTSPSHIQWIPINFPLCRPAQEIKPNNDRNDVGKPAPPPSQGIPLLGCQRPFERWARASDPRTVMRPTDSTRSFALPPSPPSPLPSISKPSFLPHQFPSPLCLTAHFSFSPPLPPPTLCPYWTNQSHRPNLPFTFDGRPPFRNVSDHFFTRVSKTHLAIQSNAWPIREWDSTHPLEDENMAVSLFHTLTFTWTFVTLATLLSVFFSSKIGETILLIVISSRWILRAR